jgi:hypothetical protein
MISRDTDTLAKQVCIMSSEEPRLKNKFERIIEFRQNKKAYQEENLYDLNHNLFKSPKKRSFEEMLIDDDESNNDNDLQESMRSTPTKLQKIPSLKNEFRRINTYMENLVDTRKQFTTTAVTIIPKQNRLAHSTSTSLSSTPKQNRSLHSTNTTKNFSSECSCDDEWTLNEDKKQSTTSSPTTHNGQPTLDKTLVNYFRNKKNEWKNYDRLLVDTHCHFEMLFTK